MADSYVSAKTILQKYSVFDSLGPLPWTWNRDYASLGEIILKNNFISGMKVI